VGFSDLEEMEQDQNLMAEISMHPYNGQIAILLDYGSLWALRQQNHNGDMDYLRLLFVYYRALLRLGLQADVVSAEADLSGYKLVILPSAYVTTDQLVHSLKNYIESGMTVLIGMRSGVKTNSNLLTDAPLPGLFRELSGVRVKEWHSLPPGIGYDLQSSIPDLTGKATMWAEGLVPELADGSPAYTPQVLARYSSGPFCKAAALTERQMGVGKVLYLGWSPDERQAMAILEYLAKSKGIPPIASIPEGMVAFQRGPYRVLLNFTDQTLQADVDGQTVIVKPREIEIARGK
jgi:beta-galactosidase